MKIAFITDGGLKMGMGHITRTTTLAEEFRDKAEIYFLTKSDDIIVRQIKNSNFDTLKADNDSQILNLFQEIKSDIVIIDKLEVEESFAKKLKGSIKTRLVIFDNTSAANKYADIVVNAVMGSNYRNRKFFDEKTNTLYFYGLKYEVLRKEFYAFKKPEKIFHDKVVKILLIFGGSDPLNLTSAVLDELLGQQNDFKIDAILGAYFEYVDELNRVLAKHPGKKGSVNIFKNIKNVAELMYQADLVIASPGLSVFEALYVGIPVLSFHQSPFQKNGFKGFLPTLDKSEAGKLGGIIANAEFADPQGEYIKAFEIGEGKTEVIKAIIGS